MRGVLRGAEHCKKNWSIPKWTKYQYRIQVFHLCTISLNTSHDRIFANFQNCVHSEKDLKDKNTIASIWGKNMLEYLSLDIICSSKLTLFLELHSWKTVRFLEQIMSTEKYPSIFQCQMEAIVYEFWLLFIYFSFSQELVINVGKLNIEKNVD